MAVVAGCPEAAGTLVGWMHETGCEGAAFDVPPASAATLKALAKILGEGAAALKGLALAKPSAMFNAKGTGPSVWTGQGVVRPDCAIKPATLCPQRPHALAIR